jgi:hypothetical protein
MNHQLTVVVYPEGYAICRLGQDAAVPAWIAQARFLSITRTERELSIVCEENSVPAEVHAERNRRLMRVEGTLGFSLTGVLASLTAPLATAGISVFAISTYDTDYLLVSKENLQEAAEVLEAAGHVVRQHR